MEQPIQMKPKRRRNPLLIFVSVFYLLLGAAVILIAGLACWGLVLQGEALLGHSTFPALAMMMLIGLLMAVAGVRGLMNRAGYLMGALVIGLGLILVIYGLVSGGFNPSSLFALALGGLYTLGARIGKKG